MAVTLTQLAAAMRLGNGVDAPVEPLASILQRHLDVGTALVEKEAPEAPDAVKEEAVIRVSAYSYDSPLASPGVGFADAWRNSGAASLVSRWRELRVVAAGDA